MERALSILREEEEEQPTVIAESTTQDTPVEDDNQKDSELQDQESIQNTQESQEQVDNKSTEDGGSVASASAVIETKGDPKRKNESIDNGTVLFDPIPMHTSYNQHTPAHTHTRTHAQTRS